MKVESSIDDRSIWFGICIKLRIYRTAGYTAIEVMNIVSSPHPKDRSHISERVYWPIIQSVTERSFAHHAKLTGDRSSGFIVIIPESRNLNNTYIEIIIAWDLERTFRIIWLVRSSLAWYPLQPSLSVFYVRFDINHCVTKNKAMDKESII